MTAFELPPVQLTENAAVELLTAPLRISTAPYPPEIAVIEQLRTAFAGRIDMTTNTASKIAVGSHALPTGQVGDLNRFDLGNRGSRESGGHRNVPMVR